MLGLKDFILWDKTHNKFLNADYIKGIAFDNGKLHYIATNRKPKGLHSDLFNEEVEFLYDIGLKDINDKSIYADCSIIEYIIHGVHEFIKLWGVVTYDENNCCYVIKVKNQDDYTYPVGNICSITKFNIKIIDTIQENKLGLIK